MLQKWRKQVDCSLHLSTCDFHVFGPHKKELKDHRIRLDKDIRAVVQCFQQQPRESLCREYINWCVSGMPASPQIGTIINGLCVFTQINLWTRFKPHTMNSSVFWTVMSCIPIEVLSVSEEHLSPSSGLKSKPNKNPARSRTSIQQASYYFMICHKLTLSVVRLLSQT